jgi:hypothetical protein
MKCRKQNFMILFDFAFFSFELPTSGCLLFVETLTEFNLNNSFRQIMFSFNMYFDKLNELLQDSQVLLKPFFLI